MSASDDNPNIALTQTSKKPPRLEVDPPGQPLPNARRFVDAKFAHQETSLILHQGGMFYLWDGTCWPTLDDAELRAQLYNFFDKKVYQHETKNGMEIKSFAPNRYKVADLTDALRAVSHVLVSTVTPSWFTNNPIPADEVISCSNGLVHVPSRTLYPHTPTFYSHHAVPFEFDAQAPVPQRWLGFLHDLWGDDRELIETLQEIAGYLVSGDTRLQKMFLLVGPKRSGKGTIARVLKSMIGTHNVAGPTLASLSTNFGLSPLIGKPVAIISDARLTASDTSIVTERLLSISGEDTLTVDRKYREPWTGQIPSRFLILSNELPRLSDSSGALASRFIVLTMTISFYGRENPDLTAELCNELPGIFNWALDGFERLRDRGRFVQPASSQDAIRVLEDLGSPVGAFLRDACQIGEAFSVPRARLYQAWRSWCDDHGRRATAAETFGRDLRSVCPGIRGTRPRELDGKRYYAYGGVGLVQGRPGTAAMYYQQSGSRGSSSDNDDLVHGPAWTGPEFATPTTPTLTRACRKCDGEGCDWCGEWKPNA